jgi:4-hydroxybenzoate polyprenyltransferase
LAGVVRTMRPHQWVKNLFVIAPVFFARNLTDAHTLIGAASAFVVFCFLAGAIYTLNDLIDVEADRLHPVKRARPIAAGVVPLSLARVAFACLIGVSLLGALFLPAAFGVVAFAYFALNTAYSLKLKKFAYIDVGCIATGFVLRVLAGGAATQTPVSGYMLGCTLLLALFLGFGKRLHELSSAKAEKQRAALKSYTRTVLLRALGVTGIASVGTYLAYTLDAHTEQFFRSGWLWMTTLHPLIGVLRFLHIIRSRPDAESPTQEMLRDTPFMLNLFVWIAEVVVIVYRLRPT